MDNRQKDTLSECIERAFESADNSTRHTDNREPPLSFGHHFFKTWFFSDRSRAYLFVFKKNYRITNIQYAELLALLRVHSHPTYDQFDPVETLHFISTDDFRGLAQRMSEAFDLSSAPMRQRVAKLYAPVFQPTVAVEKRFGCCEVYLPPGLDIELASMCAASGYIDSCGYNIFVRKAYKTTSDEFVRELIAYTTAGETEQVRRIYFAAYSHEDFDEYDAEERRVLRDGLDDLKIALEKFYMGRERIVDVLKAIKGNTITCLRLPEQAVRVGNKKRKLIS